MFNPCTLDVPGRGRGASEDGLLCLTLLHLIQGGGGKSIRRWTVMFNPCTLDVRGRGEASEDGLLSLTLVRWM